MWHSLSRPWTSQFFSQMVHPSQFFWLPYSVLFRTVRETQMHSSVGKKRELASFFRVSKMMTHAKTIWIYSDKHEESSLGSFHPEIIKARNLGPGTKSQKDSLWPLFIIKSPFNVCTPWLGGESGKEEEGSPSLLLHCFSFAHHWPLYFVALPDVEPWDAEGISPGPKRHRSHT